MTTWVIVAYGIAALLALAFLFIAGPRRWFWHVLSILFALVVGLIPTPSSLNSQQGSLIVGSIFTFFFLWGVAAPLFLKRRRRV